MDAGQQLHNWGHDTVSLTTRYYIYNGRGPMDAGQQLHNSDQDTVSLITRYYI